MNPYIQILLVEDEESDAFLVSRTLKQSVYYKFDVVVAGTLSAAMKQLEATDFNVCLLDLGMPDGCGIESLRVIRSIDARIPIVVLTGNDDEALGLTAIETGAQDFIAKNSLDSRSLSRALVFAIARQNTVLGLAADAHTDMLTGLPNRRMLSSDFERMLAKCDHLSVAILDIDNFKSINSEFGHLVGDRMLQHVASVVRQYAGDDVQATRFGGEEFALLIPESNVDSTFAYAEALLRNIEDAPLVIDGNRISVTASIGITQVQLADGLEESLHRADLALYSAKQSGRNRVCASKT
ncbi:Response regulator PleD [Rubripirellula tenax]|uniref:diguanylate cyclase n=1 Tax=Rubripirellula tenax TaxID=2528015 RepID=A0A5C6EBH2_9BACT|nr:diguanylate cyclase [Rubripirellula tenax]TWU46238.1 Response regulator PleD [Rubripirellula tenax]